MTPGKGTSRRDYLKLMAAGAGLAATAPASWAQEAVKKTMTADPQAPPPDHDRRIQWWQEAKFGMFVHWGLYSVIGRHEWAMEMEGIPIPQYEMLAKHFNPKPNAARVSGVYRFVSNRCTQSKDPYLDSTAYFFTRLGISGRP
jgi:alpha-L-fucosidase